MHIFLLIHNNDYICRIGKEKDQQAALSQLTIIIEHCQVGSLS